MTPAPRQLPRALAVLVRAFAPYERTPLLGAAQLARGLSIQLAYRWGTGQVLMGPDGRSVLLWSHVGRTGRLLGQLRGVAAGVVVGLAFFLLSNLAFAGILLTLGMPAGIAPGPLLEVSAGFALLRLTLTLSRAVAALAVEQRWMRRLAPTPHPRWRVDYLAASPAGRGRGAALLASFVVAAEVAGAEVVLVCDPAQRGFYRRHGFRVVPGGPPEPTSLLLRRLPAAARASSRGLARRAPAVVTCAHAG